MKPVFVPVNFNKLVINVVLYILVKCPKQGLNGVLPFYDYIDGLKFNIRMNKNPLTRVLGKAKVRRYFPEKDRCPYRL